MRQRWQLGDVARYTPSFIHRQHLGYVSIGFCLAPIDVSERLAGVVNVEFHKVELVRVMERGFTSRRIFSNAESG